MKKSSVIFGLCVLATVPMVLLTLSIRENKAEQQAMNAVPAIKDGETRSSEWGKYYPRQYDTYMQTRKSDEIADVLKADPALVVMWAGYPFSKDYNKPRGHYYALEDNINTLRTGAPVDNKTGPLPTACWTSASRRTCPGSSSVTAKWNFSPANGPNTATRWSTPSAAATVTTTRP